jgi:hypothetical protein
LSFKNRKNQWQSWWDSHKNRKNCRFATRIGKMRVWQQPPNALVNWKELMPDEKQLSIPTDQDQELEQEEQELLVPIPGGGSSRKYVAYTVKLPSEQLAALNSIWLELKRSYGAHSPDKSGMIQQAITDWLKRWDGPERKKLLQDLLEIREDTRRRQYRKMP